MCSNPSRSIQEKKKQKCDIYFAAYRLATAAITLREFISSTEDENFLEELKAQYCTKAHKVSDATLVSYICFH